MYRPISRILPACLVLMLLLACNFSTGAATPTPVPPAVVTFTPTPVPAAVITFTPTPVPPAVITFTPTPVPGPLVLLDTLCWVGPGSRYDVVSALHSGQQVTLLGRGSIAGWYVVDNPTYHIPCWVAESALQLAAGSDLTGLKVFSPLAPAAPTNVPGGGPTNVPGGGPTKVPGGGPTKVPTAVPTWVSP